MPKHMTVNQSKTAAHQVYRDALKQTGASPETVAAAEQVIATRESELSPEGNACSTD
jgi:hypothetical protein